MTKPWQPPTRKRVTKADLDRALAADAAAARSELRARHVTYDAAQDTVFLWVENGAALGFARARVPALAGLPVGAMGRLSLWPDGTVLELPEHDVHLSVSGLLRRVVQDLRPRAAVRPSAARGGGPPLAA